jgi:hypothetical protein
MFRYSIQLPFYLNFNLTQTFDLQLTEQKVRLTFVNPAALRIPPAPLTALTFDSQTPLTPEKLEEIRLFVNRIFRAYRLITKQTFNSGTITQLAKQDFLNYVQYGEIGENEKLIGKPRFISYIHRLNIGGIGDEEFSEIRRLAESPDLILERSYDEILLQAKSFFDQENFRMALLEAVIALEIVVSSIISRIATEKGISEGETGDFLVRVGLAYSLEVVLKLLIPESLPREEVILGCKGANTIRNGIMHKARLSVSQSEAEDAINNIEMFISQVKSRMVR